MERSLRRLIADLSGQAGATKGRDPYKELFDHACDDKNLVCVIIVSVAFNSCDWAIEPT